jgi:hypothetical protein
MYDYVINGNMIAGFGLIAHPVEYREPSTRKTSGTTPPNSPTRSCCSIPMTPGTS